MLPVPLFPEIDAGERKAAVAVDKAREEVGGCPRRRPELAVEIVVSELTPGCLVGKQSGSCLIDLVKPPGRSQRSVCPIALEPQPLRSLMPGQPA
ncbi:MAG: hypothetical protein C4306_12330 [Thermoleophilia bacterium]